jgi:hypothetical protein
MAYSVADWPSSRAGPKEDSPVYILDEILVSEAAEQFEVASMKGRLVPYEYHDISDRYPVVFATPTPDKFAPTCTFHQQSSRGQ